VLNLPDKLAGEKIRCKRCQKVLSVPTLGSRVHSSAPAQTDSTSKFLVAGSRACSGCERTYPPSIVVCVSCGLNLDTGAMLYASLEDQKKPDFHGDDDDDDDDDDDEGWFAMILRKLGFGKK
jgi:hypothetical protein